jgi:hypothetical protein
VTEHPSCGAVYHETFGTRAECDCGWFDETWFADTVLAWAAAERHMRAVHPEHLEHWWAPA